jgi:hypothetical protein
MIIDTLLLACLEKYDVSMSLAIKPIVTKKVGYKMDQSGNTVNFSSLPFSQLICCMLNSIYLAVSR